MKRNLQLDSSSMPKFLLPVKAMMITTVLLLTVSVATATNYYTNVNGAPNTLTNWWTNTNGTGSHPANFTTVGDNFIIQNGDNMTATAVWTVTGTITINSGGTLSRGTNNVTCGVLVINGTSNNGNGGSFTVNGNVSGTGTITAGVPSRVFNVTGDWTFSGTVTAGDAISVTLNGTGNQTLSGVISNGTTAGALIINKSSGSVELGSNINNAGGSFTLTSGTFDANTYLLTSTTSTLTAGTLRVGAATWATNYSFTPTPSAGFTIEYYNNNPTINGAITYQNLQFSGTGTAGASAALTIQGNLTNTGGGTLNFGANNIILSGTIASQSIDGFSTSGALNISKTSGTATLSGATSAGSLTFTASGATLSVSSTLAITNAVTLNNAAAANVTATITGAGTLTCSTIAIGNNTAATGNNTTYTHNLTSTIASLTVSGNLNINSYFTGTNRVRNGIFTHTSGIVTVSGSVVTNNANTANNSSYIMGNSNPTLNLDGATPFSISGTGTSTTTLNGTGATVNYDGTGAQPVRTTLYTNLSLSGGNTKTFSAATTINSNLSIASGTVADLGTYTSSANTMTLGGEGVMNGSWGSSSSSATYKNDTYFSATSGIINVATSTCTQPQGSLTANGPFCATGTGQLTWTATAGTGPFTVVYNDGTANRTQNSVTSGTPFNVFTNPVTSSTTYTLVSVTGPYCSRSSGFTGNSATITVNTIPTAPSTTGALICIGGTATLSASGAVSGDRYKWYDASSGGTLLKTSTDYLDNNYTTTVLASTTNYWVSIISSAGCESSRSQVTATFPSSSPDSQTTAGNDSWIGHTYDDINFNTYYGYYTESETFDQNFGGDYNCFSITSSLGTRSIYTETFSVHYRMNSTKKGLYIADLGSDDGTILTVDGTPIYTNWADQAFSSRPRVLMNLIGTSSLVYDFYENAINNRVVFQNFTLVLSNNLTTNTSQNVCLGNAGSAISGDVYGSLPTGVTLSGTGYQWAWGTSSSGPWTDISGATSATCTPSSATAPFNSAGTYYIIRKAILSSANNVSPNPYVATNVSNVATFVVNSLPIALVLTGSTICTSPGGNGTITSTTSVSGINYQLFDATNTPVQALKGGTGSGLTWSSLAAGTGYYVIGTNGNSCTSTSNTVDVTTYPNFTAGAINTTGETICYNGDPSVIGSTTVASGGDGTITYQWQSGTDGSTFPTTISSSNSPTYDPPANLTVTTYYRRQAHDGTCNTGWNTSTGVWQVTVYSNFTAGAINTTGETICYNGDPSVIGSTTVASGGDGTITYQWQSGTDGSTFPTTISSSNSPTYDPPANLTVTTYYRRQAHDGTCNTGWNTSTGVWQVTVYSNFTAGAINTTGETICYNGDPSVIGSATAASGGDGTITYQWQSGTDGSTFPTTISSSNSPTYDPPANLTVTTYYRRQAHDGTCNTGWNTSTGVWQVTVRSNFTAGAINTTGETICYNGDPSVIGSATAASGGDGTITYQWQSGTDGSTFPTTISSSNSATYDPPANLTVTTYYRRQAHDGTCNTGWNTSTGVWQVTVRSNFTAGAINTTGETICYNGDPSVIGSATDASGGDGTITYQWQSGTDGSTFPTTISSSNSATYDPPANLTVTTYYRRQAHDGTCNTDWNTSTGVWQVTVRSNFTAGAINTTGETICYNGDPSVIGSASAASGGDGTITYQWQSGTDGSTFPTTISSSNSATYDPPANLTVTTYYRRQAHDGTCNTGWNTSTGVWQVMVYSVVNFGTITSGDETICNGGDPANITFATAPSGGAGTFNYQWYYQDGIVTCPSGTSTSGWTLISGATSNSYDPPTGLTGSRTYAILVDATGSPDCGAATWATNCRKVTVNPAISITLGSNPAVCSGIISANLTYSGTSGSPDQYSINYDATAEAQGFTDVTDATLTSSPIVLTVPGSAATGTYNGTLTVKNSSTGCSSSGHAISVTVNPLPINSYTVSDTTICSGQEVTIKISGTQSDVRYYLRDNSDNTVLDSLNGSGFPRSFYVTTENSKIYNILAKNITTGCSAELTDLSHIDIIKFNSSAWNNTQYIGGDTISHNPSSSPDICPQLTPPDFNPDNDHYNVGATYLLYRVDRQYSTENWSFTYTISGTNLTILSTVITGDVETPSAVGQAVDAKDNNHVFLRFKIQNITNANIIASFHIAFGIDAVGCGDEYYPDDDAANQTIEPMPTVGPFN